MIKAVIFHFLNEPNRGMRDDYYRRRCRIYRRCNIVKALNDDGYTDILVVDNLKDGAKFVNLVDLNIADYMDKEDFIAGIVRGG